MRKNVGAEAKPKRRWLRFSLRGLLLATAGVAGWLGWQARIVNQQQRAVRLIEEADGSIQYGTTIQSPWLRGLLGDAYCQKVIFVGLFDLDHTKRDCLNAALGLRSLRSLSLTDVYLTDSNLEQICAMDDLRQLSIVSESLSDTSVQRLAVLNGLEELSLSGSQVTEDSKATLKGMTHLKSLQVFETKLSQAAVKELRRALPNCQVNIDTPTMFGTPPHGR